MSEDTEIKDKSEEVGRTLAFHYRLIPGEKLKRDDGYVDRSDFPEYCRTHGLRETTIDEMWDLVIDEHKQVDRGGHTIVIFTDGLLGSVSVRSADNTSRGAQDFMYLGTYKYLPHCLFIAVCVDCKQHS